MCLEHLFFLCNYYISYIHLNITLSIGYRFIRILRIDNKLGT